MKNILMLFMALLMSLPIVAQQRRVSGVVVDQKDGSAIIGANVLEKGTRNGAVADVNGNFSLNVTSSNPTLVITSIGYKTLEMSIGNQTSLRISMEDETAELEEVVVVGYGTMKKKRPLGCIGFCWRRKDQRINHHQPRPGISRTRCRGNFGNYFRCSRIFSFYPRTWSIYH